MKFNIGDLIHVAGNGNKVFVVLHEAGEGEVIAINPSTGTSNRFHKKDARLINEKEA